MAEAPNYSRLKQWGDAAKALAGLAAFAGIVGGGLLWATNAVLDIQTRAVAKVQHDEIVAKSTAEIAAAKAALEAADAETKGELRQVIDKNHTEIKSDIRDTQHRIDAVYRAVRGMP